MPYRIRWVEGVREQIREAPRRIQRDAWQEIDGLIDDPYPPTAEFLRDQLDDTLRVKINGWRLFYRVNAGDQVVLLLAFRRRDKDTYKNVP